MERLLHVCASPRSERSLSSRIAETFLSERGSLRDIEVDYLDLWANDLPEVNGALLDAKYAGLSGNALTETQEAAWAQIRCLAERFFRADTLVFSVPLWNFGIPYKLKHLIDVISHKDVLFTFDGVRLNGMLGGRTAVVIYTRGLDYGSDSHTPAALFDHQRPYMETWFRLIGIMTVHTIIAERTVGIAGLASGDSAIVEVKSLAKVLP
jgi:FMN-dependent NADH-azoreductase